jgi:hypothetical protein
MALRLASVLLIAIYAIGFVAAIPPPPTGECGPNEEYRKCGLLACEPSCAHPNPRPCPLVCAGGCFCKSGYVKSANGQCVRPDECETVHHIPMQIPDQNAAVAATPTEKAQCDQNEEFRTCGPFCEPTCAHQLRLPHCSLRCKVGCFCKKGYLRNHEHKCVPVRECEPPQNMIEEEQKAQCGENEEYRTCGPMCQPTCAKKLPIPFCSLRCKVGCFCKGGFLKDQEGKCVAAEKCTSEHTPVQMPMRKITLKPEAKSTGGPIQIPLQMIPAELHCPNANEEFHPCGVQLDCLARCKVQKTGKCLERKCTPACVCRHPLVRGEDGHCMKETECPKSL